MFYIFPPNGFTTLSTLEQDLNTRFKLLIKLTESGDDTEKVTEYLKSSVTCNFDGLIEGSRRDCASHFIFRFACVAKGRIQDYWIEAEKRLLLYRLKRAGNCYLQSEVTKLYFDLEKLPNSLYKGIHLQMFIDIYNGIKVLTVNEAIIKCDNRNYCHHYFKVPWTLVKNLVSQRKVEVKSGNAVISCIHIFDFLTACFEELLILGIKQMKSLLIDDVRLISLVKHLHSLFIEKAVSYSLPNGKFGSKHILISEHQEVKKVINNIPLCMQQLQSQLMECNRLRHSERYRFSLFLKDIGLPLEQNIAFWQKYYSRPSKCSSSGCSHVWEGVSAKRFIYSIRHMYGLEGKRVCYSAHSCLSLQGMQPQPQELGGCPFKHLDEHQLRNLLCSNKFLWLEQIEEIIRASKLNNPSRACGYYLSAISHKHNRDSKKIVRIATYDHMKQCSNRKYLKDRSNHFTMRKTRSSSACVGRIPLKGSGNESCVSPNVTLGKIAIKTKKETCEDCSFTSLPPEFSHLSPVDYFKLSKLQILQKN